MEAAAVGRRCQKGWRRPSGRRQPFWHSMFCNMTLIITLYFITVYFITVYFITVYFITVYFIAYECPFYYRCTRSTRSTRSTIEVASGCIQNKCLNMPKAKTTKYSASMGKIASGDYIYTFHLCLEIPLFCFDLMGITPLEKHVYSIRNNDVDMFQTCLIFIVGLGIFILFRA